MECLSKLILAKRLPIRDILSANCTISVKEDGNAFQIYKTPERDIVYGKRYNVPYNLAKNVTEFDIASYRCYHEAISHFSSYYIYRSICEFIDVKMFNFEIIDPSVNHVIKNDEYKMILLSAYTYDNQPVSQLMLQHIANKLKVSVKNILFDGTLTESGINLLLSLKDSPDDIKTRLWDVFNSTFSIPKNIEGIVLEFNDDEKNIHRVYKIQSPEFKEQIDEHLNEEATIRFNEIDDAIAEKINVLVRKHYIELFDDDTNHKKVNSYFAILLKIFINIVDKDKNIVNNFFICNKISNFELLKNVPINLPYMKVYFGQDFYKYEPYIPLLKYILLVFRTERTKQPLLCSQEMQEKINETIRILCEGTHCDMVQEIQKSLIQKKTGWISCHNN